MVSQAGRAHRRGVLLPAHRGRGLRLPQAEARACSSRSRARFQRALDGRARGRRLAARPAGGRGGRRAADPGAHRQGREDARGGRPARRHAGLSGPAPTPRRSPRSSDAHDDAALRSALYLAILVVITPFLLGGVRARGLPLPRLARWHVIAAWPQLATWLARYAARHPTTRCAAARTFPREPVVILSKHQSAWETLAYTSIFPPHVYVIKRELLWLPVPRLGARADEPDRHQPRRPQDGRCSA